MRIGIPLRKEKEKLYINSSYLKEITPIFISANNLELLKLCDAILLPGGYDLSNFWTDDSLKCSGVDIYNDWLDFYLIYYANKHDIPLLGICRGLQSINVYYNGTLKNVKNHQNGSHKLKTKCNTYTVNSFHHQAIKKIGNDLCAFGHSLDNVIEIILHESKPIVGFQFHPEKIDENFIYHYFNSKLEHSVSLLYFADGLPT